MWLPFSWGGGLINKRQKEVLEYQLEEEKKVIQELEKRYNQALKDINEKVKLFQADIDLLDEALSQDGLDDATKALLQSQMRSKVYQQTYQRALKSQISGILDKMQGDNFAIIDKYLNGCYETGYIGTLYDIAGQGIPIITPVDQAAVVKAVQLDSKISNGLYSALGMDTKRLKKNITQEISRGIASSLSYSDISRNLKNTSGVPLYNAKRIVRTESHRIQQQSAEDSRRIAKNKGADIVRMWDAALDGRTRDSHRMVDGEIRELDEKFSNGLMFPGDPSGSAAEVVNCRCVALTRARWALDDGELQTLKERAEYFGLDKTANFEDYKQKYLVATAELEYNSGDQSDSSVFDGIIGKQTGMTTDYKDALNLKFAKGSDEAKKAFNKFVPSDSVADAAFAGTAHFNPATQKINMNFADDLQNKRGAGATFFHEHGHFIDFMAAGASNYDYLSTTSQTFGALLQSDFKEYVKTYKKQHKMKAADAYNAILLELLGHEKHSLSDLLDGISKGKCSGMYGHKRSYWSNQGALEKEAFAHMFEASFDSNKYALMKQYFPNALAEFEKMLKGVI